MLRPLMWIVRQPDAGVSAALQAAGFSPFISRLLALRHIDTPELARTYLNPPLRDLPDPHLLAGAQQAAERIARAIENKEKICIYGDYDVDGISAAALLDDLFCRIGYPVSVFLPDRFRDGYGLHQRRLQELCDQGVQLFISVDCGTTAVAEIAAVRARGVDFIVVDHHSLGPVLPDATVLLNPQQDHCRYPDKHLCAVGVAFVLAQAVRRAIPDGKDIDIRPLLEFAALGTIADVVALRDVNRLLAWHGLRQLGQSQRLGIIALAALSPKPTSVSADRVGFGLGPHINAAGRVADPMSAFRLLRTCDAAEAETLAAQIDVDNNRRREAEKSALASALQQAHDQPGRQDAVIVAHADWHQGVVGIVAARLKDQFDVPALVLAIGADGFARGSGRSISGYNLVDGLAACNADEFLEKFGGHAYAAGLTIRTERIDTLRQRLTAHVAQALPLAARKRELLVDAEVQVPDLTLAMLAELETLEPFGKDNPRPNFLLRGVQLTELTVIGKDKNWARGKLLQPGTQAAWARLGIGVFGALALFADVKNEQYVDAVVRLERNDFKGRVSLQATALALVPAGSTPV